MSRPQDILDFWLEGLNDATVIDNKARSVKKWFIKDEDFDRTIRERFEADMNKAREGKYQAWEADPRTRLALVILFDQFTRNIYRNTPQMFATDPLALALSRRTVEEKEDCVLSLIERVFLCMPFMHAEDLQIQELSVRSYEQIVAESAEKCPQNTPYFQSNHSFAVKHLDIVKRFGRFPHRNAILGRPSTPEETEFLTQAGSSF